MGMDRKTIGLGSGKVGMGPKRARVGDKICVLLGCSIHVVLRELKAPAEKGDVHYESVG